MHYRQIDTLFMFADVVLSEFRQTFGVKMRGGGEDMRRDETNLKYTEKQIDFEHVKCMFWDLLLIMHHTDQ